MSVESQGLDPYDAVLADLKAKRDQIDQAIQVIEGVRGVAASPGGQTPAASSQNAAPNLGAGAFLGLSIPEATKKLLSARKQALGSAEIVAALKAGGMAMESNDPINTVGSVLTRRFNTIGDIVRVSRGIWGLQEWYPGKNFKKKGGKGEAGEDAKGQEGDTPAELD
jgi:hypothetical protein